MKYIIDFLKMPKTKFYWCQIKPESLSNEEFLEYVKNAIPRRFEAAKEMLETASQGRRLQTIRNITKTVGFLIFDCD